MNWLLLGANSLAWLILSYSHQINIVADSSYPVTKPIGNVSIIVPAFNEEAFIERTLLCVQSQNIVLEYPDLFEIIVVDNQSTDRTPEIASKYAKVVTAKRGKLNAKNVGVRSASGDIIVFLDSDVIIKPNYLNLLLRHFHKPEVVAVSGGLFSIDGNLLNIGNTYNNLFNAQFHGHFYGGGCALLTDAYYAIGGYDLTVNQFDRNALRKEEEFLFLQRLKQLGKVIVDSQATLWVSSRYYWCLAHPANEICSDPYCIYCSEVRTGLRF